MEKFMPELHDQRDRVQALQESAAKIEQKEYYTPLTQGDLDLKREQFTDNSIWLGNEKAKMKELVDTHKENIKPKAEENMQLLQEITTKQSKKEGIIYHVPDYDNGIMVTYDEEGEFVESRRLRPEEKKGQSRMFVPATKTA